MDSIKLPNIISSFIEKPQGCKLCPFAKHGVGFIADEGSKKPLTLIRYSPSREEVEMKQILPLGTSFGNWARDLLTLALNEAGMANEDINKLLQIVYLHKCYIPPEQRDKEHGRVERYLKEPLPCDKYCIPQWYRRSYDVLLYTYDFLELQKTPAYTRLFINHIKNALIIYKNAKDRGIKLNIGVTLGPAVFHFYNKTRAGGLKLWNGHWQVISDVKL